MSLFNKYVSIFQNTGDFFSDSTHHVGFPLSPFTDLLRIHGYDPTLYTVEPPLSGHYEAFVTVLVNIYNIFSTW